MLLKLSNSDKILIRKDYCDKKFEDECVFSSYKEELEKINENFFEIRNSYNTSLLNNPNTMFMFKVSPDAIKSVYLGCRMKDEDINKLIELKEREDLKHIKLYKSSIHDKRYELIFFEI